MMKIFLHLLFLVLPVAASSVETPQIDTALVIETTQAAPGSTVLVGVHIKMQEHWHTYWKDSGDAGLPTTVEWTVPAGVKMSEIQWPRPLVFHEEGDVNTIGYKDEVTLLASMTVPAHWPIGKSIEIKARVKWLACKVACVPGSANLAHTLPIGSSTIADTASASLLKSALAQVPTEAEEKEILATFQKRPAAGLTLGTAILFAFLGGLLLNIMPCVLPVLSLKIFRLVKQADRPRSERVGESLYFALGVLLSFAALAGVVIGLKSVGQQIGWGFQFQEPRFVVVLAAIVFTFGLSLFGVYEFSILVPGRFTKLAQQGGTVGALWDGFLATLLATPCTAPFLGAALGFSFSQPPAVIMLLFLLIGVGLASPYVALSAAPGWTKLLPKPGNWMETFKQFMGFPLVGTALWLLWVLGRQTGSGAVIAALVLLFVIAFGLWLMGRFRGWIATIITLLLVAVTYTVLVKPTLAVKPAATAAVEGWLPFSSTEITAANAAGKTVFVDFTADWCLTCQLNKRVLHSDRITAAFKEAGVITMKADWTNGDPDITRVLTGLKRSGVPVYAIYDPEKSGPVLLPELLTESIVLDAIN